VPLSSAECLAAALRVAAASFSVADHSFTVLLKGHGFSERILVPRKCVRDTEISQEWLARVFDGRAGDSARRYRNVMEVMGFLSRSCSRRLERECRA